MKRWKSPTQKYTLTEITDAHQLAKEDEQKDQKPKYPSATNVEYHLINIEFDAANKVTTRVFIPPNYRNDCTLFFIPGTASRDHFPESEKKFCSHLSKKFNCRVIAIFHHVGSGIFYKPLNDIKHAVNCYLEFIDLSEHYLYFGGYSSGGLASILITLEAIYYNLPVQWLLLIAPAVDLTISDSRKSDHLITPDFYNRFITAFIGEQNRQIYSRALAPLHQSRRDLALLPATTIVVGDQDPLADEIKKFFNMLSNLHNKKFIEIPGEDHCLPWRQIDFLEKIAPPAHYGDRPLTKIYRFNEMLHADSLANIHRRLTRYGKIHCTWHDDPILIRHFENNLSKIMRTCISAVCYLRYFAPLSKGSIYFLIALQLSNNLSIYYLSIKRNTKLAEHPLRIGERILDFLNSIQSHTTRETVSEKSTLLNHRSLQALFDNDSKTLAHYSNSALQTLEESKQTDLISFAVALVYKGHSCYSSNDFNSAWKWYEKALKAKEKYYKNKYHADIAASLEDIGNVAREKRNFSEALKYHMRALKIKEKHFSRTKKNSRADNLAYSHRAIADIHLLQHKYAKALLFYIKASHLFENADEIAITTLLLLIVKILVRPGHNFRINVKNIMLFKSHPAYQASNSMRKFVLYKLPDQCFKADEKAVLQLTFIPSKL